MTPHTVSLIVPVYKTQPWLRECVDSILGQTYPHLDVMLIDDGSPDLCPAICDEYARRDRRVRVFHKPNTGLADVCNYGLERIRGDFVMFCDSDDTLSSQMVESMLKVALRYDADIVETENEQRMCQDTTDVEVIKRDEALRRMLATATFTQMRWTKMYRASLVADVRLPRGVLNEDILFNAMALHGARVIARLPQVLYRYRLYNPGGITSSHKSITHTYENVARIEAIYADEAGQQTTMGLYRGRVAASICLMCRKFGIRGRFKALRCECRRDCRRLLPRLVCNGDFPLKERVKMLWASVLG